MTIKKLRAWLPALLWMGVIYTMSAMPGDVSGAQSGTVVRLLRALLELFIGENAARIPEDLLQLLVRKGAHMAEYAVLFFLDLYALRQSGTGRPGLTALALCAAYAATDEFHQAFVGGRGPSMIDVGIDTAGAAVGWAAARLWRRVIRKNGG